MANDYDDSVNETIEEFAHQVFKAREELKGKIQSSLHKELGLFCHEWINRTLADLAKAQRCGCDCACDKMAEHTINGLPLCDGCYDDACVPDEASDQNESGEEKTTRRKLALLFDASVTLRRVRRGFDELYENAALAYDGDADTEYYERIRLELTEAIGHTVEAITRIEEKVGQK